MRYRIPCILLALTTCGYADDPKSKAIRQYANKVEVLRKQGQASIKRLEAVFEKEVEKLREETLKDLQKELDAAFESKDLDKAVALKKAIEEFESAEASGLSTKGEVATEKRVKKRIPRTALKFKGHHYAINPSLMSWHVARDYCKSVGGHLVRINSREEFEFVRRMYLNQLNNLKQVQLLRRSRLFPTASGGYSIYIDGSDEDQEDVWVYSDGTPVDFSMFDFSLRRARSYQYLTLSSRKGGIVHDSTNYRAPFIIEWGN